MLEVFTEEVEVVIKDGLANLYWYKGDLHKAWLRSGVSIQVKQSIESQKDGEGRPLTKRQQMDVLYESLRSGEYNRRLEISRNFVRILIEHKNFVPQNEKHRIDIAERSALKLREKIFEQKTEAEKQPVVKAPIPQTYESKLLELRLEFENAQNLAPAKRGYELENLFIKLMEISSIFVERGYSIQGEQFDCAIKYDGCYYLIELKWTADKSDPKEIGHFSYKVDGKMNARGLFISMTGYTDGVLSTLPIGKKLNMILLDGNHLANVIYGLYTFENLLEFAIKEATLKGNIYCSHSLS